MFRTAIVRRPARSLVSGLTSSPHPGVPDYGNALRQHDDYIRALEACGLSVTVLEALEEYPDSCFVEDTAFCLPDRAVLTNPGAPSRKGEVEDMERALRSFYAPDRIFRIRAPGTLEGGDILRTDGEVFVGLSDRTNREGAVQFLNLLQDWGIPGQPVPVTGILHLKTGLSYLNGGRLLVTAEFAEYPPFRDFEKIPVPEEEAYAANCLWMNGTVLVPAGCPGIRKAVEGLGYRVLTVDTSEFRKIDGGLSCLSLRF
jgi:dimethylargininase